MTARETYDETVTVGALNIDESFAARLELAKGSESVNSLALRCGFRESLVRKYLAGSIPGADKAAVLAEKLGVSLTWLITGDGSMRPVVTTATKFAEEQRAYEGLTRVPVFELRLSAGGGEPAWAKEKPAGYLDVPTDFLERYLRVNSKHAVAFPVVGDSMEPTIRDGELAVLDTSERQISRDGGIYALRRIDELMVKRIFRRTADFLLKSDNPAFGEEPIPRSDFDEVHILGRVGGALRRV